MKHLQNQEDFSDLEKHLQKFKPAAPPSELTAKLLKIVEEKKHSNPGKRYSHRLFLKLWIPAAAACFILCFSALLLPLFINSESTPPLPPAEENYIFNFLSADADSVEKIKSTLKQNADVFKKTSQELVYEYSKHDWLCSCLLFFPKGSVDSFADDLKTEIRNPLSSEQKELTKQSLKILSNGLFISAFGITPMIVYEENLPITTRESLDNL